MGPNSIWWSDLSPVQFVPAGQVMSNKYHTVNRRSDWFSKQVTNWINQNNYWNPWMTIDTIPLQFITNGLTPVTAYLYSCTGTLISTTVLSTVASTAIIAPYLLWQGNISLVGLTPGGYYLDVKAGAGGALAELISEGLNIQVDWPGTLLFEYSHSVNKATMIFDTGFVGSFRVQGYFDNLFKQKYKGAFYTDMPQDISILNAFQYEITSLMIGGDDGGVPDYVARKVAGFLLLDSCMIEGEKFSMNESAEWEEIFTVGSPKKYNRIEIRPSVTSNATGATNAGLDQTSSILVSVDAAAFAPNAGAVPGDQQVITVTIS